MQINHNMIRVSRNVIRQRHFELLPKPQHVHKRMTKPTFHQEIIKILQVAIYKMFTLPWICSHVPDTLSPDKRQKMFGLWHTNFAGAPTSALRIVKPPKRKQFIRSFCLWKTDYRLFLVQRQRKIIYYNCLFNNC